MQLRNLTYQIILCGSLSVLPLWGLQQTSSSPAERSQMSASKGADQATSAGKLPAKDRQFIMKAGEGGKAEVELGQLAKDKASSQSVKEFGQRMVDDHTKANRQLEALAGQKGITLPDKLDAKHRALKSRLEKLSGSEFDRAYMHEMVQDHTKDVAEFQRESSAAKDPDVKSFASETLPTLKQHLSLAKRTAENGETTTASKHK
jgi:putative membrane protein